MKSFSLSLDSAYVVPALRSSAQAWPHEWRRKAGVIALVLLAHGVLLLGFLRMSIMSAPEALPMASTEVILETLAPDVPPTSAAAEPSAVSPVTPQVNTPIPKVAREAEMTETIKPVAPTKTTPAPVSPRAEPVPAAAPTQAAVAPKAATAEVAKPANQAKGAGIAFNPKPPYPRALESAGVGGTVGLSIQVNAQGRASAVTVVRSSGQAALDNSARETVLNRWKFKPARSATGEEIASTLTQSIQFKPAD